MVMTEIDPPPLPPPSSSSTPSEPEAPAQPETIPQEPPEQPQPSPVEPPPPDAPAPAVAPAPEAAPDPVSAELEEIRLKLEENDLEQRALRQQLEHERLLREDAASKAGYYKRVAVDLAAPRRQPAETPVDDYADPAETQRGAVSPDTLRFQQELDALRTDAIERAQMEAVTQFFSANPDAQAKQKELEPFVVQARARYADWLDSNDPKLIRRAAQMTLDTAWLNAQKAQIATRRTERLSSRQATLQRLAEEKRAASIPGSGAAAAPPARQANQPMTDAEAEAILNDPRTWGA